MDYMTFLLNLRVLGIKNIEKEIRIDFCGKNINKRFNPEKYKIKGIYGENGSGKSSIIAAVDIVKDFMFHKNYLRDPQMQILLRELINKKRKEFIFKCEFVTNIETIVIYEYEVAFKINDIDEDIIVSYESLKYKKNSSKNVQNVLFVCQNGEFTELDIYDEIKQLIFNKTRNLLVKQSGLYSVFSIMAQDGFKDNIPFLWVYSIIFFLSLNTHFDREDKHMEFYHKQRIEGLKNTDLPTDIIVDEIIKGIYTNESHISIKDYESYKKQISQLERFVKLFKPELKKIDIEKKENKGFYDCELLLNYGDYRVNKEFESTGIKKIIDLYSMFVLASRGAIVFIDELDSNINDVYLCKIIEYFKYYGKGQLCFTSHNTDPMQVLRDNNKSIDFISRDNRIIPWVKNGHYTPDSLYKNGMIDGLPFNIDASDLITVFEGE